MIRSMNMQQTITPLSLCLLGLLGLSLFDSPLVGQVFDSGPSDSALFDTVINLPGDEAVITGDTGESIGGPGQTTQLNLNDGGGIGFFFNANFGSEVNISGGTVDGFFTANDGSEVNISGGIVVSELNFGGFDEFRGGFSALSGSKVNIFGNEFFINGLELDTLVPGQASTITDRNVTLSGLLADGEQFSFNLRPVSALGDTFETDATLTVTLVSPVILGDVNLDNVVDFFDIAPFIDRLSNQGFQAEADIDGNGVVDFLDIAPFIGLLSGQ